VVSCTGGTPITAGTILPKVNFTLTLPQAITSRATTTGTAPFASDALLLIDDPGSAANPIDGAGGNLAGYGNNATPAPCATLTTGCNAYGDAITGQDTVVYNVISASTPGPTTGAANAYQGQISGNTVTFIGVPVAPPGSTSARTYRITNVRMNASAATAGTQSVSLAITNTTGQTGNNAGLFGSAASFAGNLGSVAAGLSATGTKWTASSPGLTTCGALTVAYAGTVSFAENFASAFKTRQLPGAAQYSAQDGTTPTQTLEGTSLTESGYELAGLGNLPAGATAGLADFGTRLKAVFTNIPSGARVFVSFTNVERQSSTNIGIPNSNYVDNTSGNLKAPVGSTATTSFAALITGAETVTDNLPTTLATPSTSAVTGSPVYANYDYVDLGTVSSTGSVTAVWEVLNTNPSANETFTFAVFVTQSAQGTTGTGTVNLSFAPTASTATTIPSFADTSGSGASSIAITSCRTILLFPYVTSAAGFETGVAVSNTTTDILGTTAQQGTCSLYVYGINPATGNAPTNNGPFSPTNAAGAAFPATGVPSGQTAQWLLSASAPGFTGYAIASCNFQYAHGFAFVFSPQLSAAMGYLPLVLPSPVTRLSSPESSTF
jgi:hypothetical protein